MIRSSRAVLAATSLFAIPWVLSAQPGGVQTTTRQNFPADPAASVPALRTLVSARTSENEQLTRAPLERASHSPPQWRAFAFQTSASPAPSGAAEQVDAAAR